MIARILLVAAAGLAAGVVASTYTKPAGACSCVPDERWVLEVRETSHPADRELWQGKFVVGAHAMYPYGEDVLFELERQP